MQATSVICNTNNSHKPVAQTIQEKLVHLIEQFRNGDVLAKIRTQARVNLPHDLAHPPIRPAD